MFFPPGFCDVWGICLLLLLIICPHFSFWINLHVCSGLFSWFYIFIYSERGPPDCKLQVPQDLNPALARGHAVSLPQAPECSFSPHISHDVTFPLGTSVAVVEAPARAPRAASVRVASVPAAHFPQMPPPPPPATCTWDQLCGPSLTEEPLHLGWPRTDRDRGTNAPSSCFRVQLWRCGLQAGAPLTRPREIPPHTPAPGSLTLCRFFLNQSRASGSGADCIYRLMVFSPPHWSITSRGQELDLSCSLCVSVAWCLAGNNYSNMGWDE